VAVLFGISRSQDRNRLVLILLFGFFATFDGIMAVLAAFLDRAERAALALGLGGVAGIAAGRLPSPGRT
jgi:uncharacterized membrane protein HdeD (DUF308 family)